MTSRVLYLHGFASGPESKKAQFFRSRLRERGVDLEIPDLAEEGFEHLTISGQLRVIERVAGGDAVDLIGSSLGGYLASLYAARHPEIRKLVLLAPAFGFARRWAETLGTEQMDQWRAKGRLDFYNYREERERPVSYALIEDGLRFEDCPDVRQPALIFHGTKDTVVPPSYSVHFAAQRPNVRLELVDSAHELTDVLETMWEKAQRFLG